MKKLLPGTGRESRRALAIAAASFGAGILVALFLSTRVLILVESVLILIVAALFLTDL